MSKLCELTGKSRYKANKVSHSNIKTRRFKFPNISRRRWEILELGKTLTLTLSAAALRTISARGGLERAILMEREENLSERLAGVKREILKKRAAGARKPKSEPAEAK